MNKLQNFVFSAVDVSPDNRLFFHTERGSVSIDNHYGTLLIEPDSIISFGTYFNSLSVGKWMHYCAVKKVTLCLEVKGKATASILFFSQEKTYTLIEKKVNTRELKKIYLTVDLTERIKNALIYLKLFSGQDSFYLESAYFCTSEPIVQKTNLSLVITTYHREHFIRKNIHVLEKDFLSCPEGSDSHVYVVDNGTTLKQSNHLQVSIIPNKNFGGAGGFARGMLEVCQKEHSQTYVVLCDDDVHFLSETFKRLTYFLSLVQHKTLCIRGAMLRSDRPWIQHENGALLNDDYHFIPQNYNLDLSQLENIYKNEKEYKSDYAGWWMFAFPAKCIPAYGYPMPVFVRWDDAEYSLRLSLRGFTTIALNGVSVWHEPFEYKFSPSMHYYEERNCIFARSIYDQNFSYYLFMRRALLKVMGNAAMYRYESAEYCLRAYYDGLQGPSFFMEVDSEKLNSEIIHYQGEKVCDFSTNKGQRKANKVVNKKNSFIFRLLCLISFNGHLLPQTVASTISGIDESIHHRPLLSNDYSQCFGARTIYYQVPGTLKGYLVSRSSIRFFSILFKYIKLFCFSYFKFKSAVKAYNKKNAYMTSERFWLKYLGLKN